MAINRGFGQDQGFSRGPGQGIGGGVGTGVGGGQGQYDFNNLAQYGNQRDRQPGAGLRQNQQLGHGVPFPSGGWTPDRWATQGMLGQMSRGLQGPIPTPENSVPIRSIYDQAQEMFPNRGNFTSANLPQVLSQYGGYGIDQQQNLQPHDWSQPTPQSQPGWTPPGAGSYFDPHASGGHPPGAQGLKPQETTPQQPTVPPPSPYLNPTMQSWTGENWNLNPNQFATPGAAQALAQNTNLFAPGAQALGMNFGDGGYYQASDPMQMIAARGFNDPLNAGLVQGQVDRYGAEQAGSWLRANESLANPFVAQQAQQYNQTTQNYQNLLANPAAYAQMQQRGQDETAFLTPIMNAGGDVNAARRVLASGGTQEQAIQAAMQSAGSANARFMDMAANPLPGATDGSVPGTPFGQAAPGNPNDPYNQHRQQLAFNHFGQLLQNNPAVFAALFGLTGGPTPAL